MTKHTLIISNENIQVARLFKKKANIHLIEYPENNMFPSNQKEFIYNLFLNAGESSLCIITHSPYILGAINNLLLTGEIYAKTKDTNEIAKIIGYKSYIPQDSFNAYQIVNGRKKSILNKETGLISENIIDEASEKLRYEFNLLLNYYFTPS